MSLKLVSSRKNKILRHVITSLGSLEIRATNVLVWSYHYKLLDQNIGTRWKKNKKKLSQVLKVTWYQVFLILHVGCSYIC